MKRITVMVMVIVMTIGFTFLIAGCGSSSDSTAETTAETTAQAEETTAGQTAEVSLASLPGDYQDQTSQRATMTIVSDDDNEVEVKVIWSDSSDKATEWDMEATLQDGKLVYNECEKEVKTYDANGNETTEQETEQGSGYFEIDNQGALLWTGAADEDCQSCIFVRITE